MKSDRMPIYIEETGANLFMWALIVNGFLLGKHVRLASSRVDTMFMYLKGNHGQWGVPEDMWNALGKSIMVRVEQGTFDLDALIRETLRLGKRIYAAAESILSQPLGGLSRKSLIRLFTLLQKPAYEISDIGLIPPASDLGHTLLTKRVQALVRSHSRETGRVAEMVTLLMTSSRMTLNRIEQEKLFDLALQVQNSLRGRKPTLKALEKAISPALARGIEQHLEKFFWLPYNYQGPVWSKRDIIERIQHLVASLKNLQAAAKEFRKELPRTATRQKQLAQKLKLTSRERFIVRVAQEFWYLKAYRAEVRTRANYAMDVLLKEIGKRFGIPGTLLRHADPDEVYRMIVSGKRISLQELKQRSQELFWLCTKGRKQIWHGKSARRALQKLVRQKTIGNTSEIAGQTAYPGIVRGKVKIVRSVKDIHKVKRGDIMVAIATNPDLLPAMNKAAAFVTDAGGITSHAAIVAREMKKPCVIGTEYATKVLHDGNRVLVDANAGTVKKL